MCIFKLSTLVCLLCIPQRSSAVHPNNDGPRQMVYKVPDERVFIVLELEESSTHEDLTTSSVDVDGPPEVTVSSQRKKNQQQDDPGMMGVSLFTELEDSEYDIYLDGSLVHKDIMPWEMDFPMNNNASSPVLLEAMLGEIRQHLDEVYLQVFEHFEQAERMQSEVRMKIHQANMLYSYAEQIRQLLGLSDSLDEIISDDPEDTKEPEGELNYDT